MEITYSADAVDLDRPAYDAQAERPDRPIRLRVQPTLLRVRQGETVGNHRSWTGVSWTLECATAEEAIEVRDALGNFFNTLSVYGGRKLATILTDVLPVQ